MTLKNNWQTGDIVTAVHLNAVADEVNETEFDATAAAGEKFPAPVREEIAALVLGQDVVVKGDLAVSVKDFGATGDGVTDDTTAIRNAVNSATDVVVHFPKGTYRISGRIQKNGGRLWINGAGATIKPTNSYSLSPAPEINAPPMFIHVDPVETVIENITIDGNSTAINGGSAFPDHTNNINAIYVYSQTTPGFTARVTVRNCHLKNFPSSGIVIQGTANARIENNIVEDGMGGGIAVARVTGSPGGYATITGNRVIGRGNLGSNTALGGIGILVVKYDKVIIADNFITNTPDTGTKTDGCNDVIYRGNIVIDSGKDGIKVMDHSFSPPDPIVYNVSRAVVEGNIVIRLNAWRTDGGSLIMVSNASHATISNNLAVGGGTRVANAIFSYRGSGVNYPATGDFTVTGNVGLGELLGGVDLRSNGSEAPLQNVTIANNRIAGNIALIGTVAGDIIIADNVLNRYDEAISGAAGVSVNGMVSGSVSIDGNTISDHVYGVLITTVGGAAVSSIRASRNTMRNLNGYGLVVDNYGADSTVESLDIVENIVTDPTAGGDTFSAPWRVGVDNIAIESLRVTRNTAHADSASGGYSAAVHITGTPPTSIQRAEVRDNVFTGSFSGSHIADLALGTNVKRLVGWPLGGAPTTGTWSVGDRIENSVPSELGSAASKYVITGWRCVAAGTPGTWVQE